MLQTSESSITHNGNTSTTTPYVVPYRFFADEDLVVVVTAEGTETTQTLGLHYTVTGANDPTGGNVIFTWAVPATSKVTISRNVEATQLTSYEEADSFPAKSHERALDKLTALVQQLSRGMAGGSGSLGTAFRLTDGSEGIKALIKKNDTMVGIDATGNSILRTANDMLGWLGQVGTVWFNDAERAQTRGAFPGQLGVQLDNWTIYIARTVEPGDWAPELPGTGIVEAIDGTPSIIHKPEGDLVGTTESQILTNKTLNNPTINNPSGMVPADVGLDQVDNVPDKFKPLSDAEIEALELKQDLAEKAVADGYASLDGGGKVPLDQIPTSLLGGNVYKGTWNASINSPAIPAAGAGNVGWYYIVGVAGSTSIDGTNTWAVGDFILSNGTIWQKLLSTSAVTSVAGKTGVVTLNPNDVGLGHVENYSPAELAALPQTVTNKTISGASNTLSVRLDADVTGNLSTSRLNNGTGAAATTWWCGDGTWKQPPGTGDISGPATTVNDDEVVVFSGITGKAVRSSGKRGSAVVTGPASVIDGQVAIFDGTSGKVIKAASPLTPIGAILDYAGINEPAGWLWCDGREVHQPDYPLLYAAIGDTYGVGGIPTQVFEAHKAATTGASLTLTGVNSSGTDRLLLVWALGYKVGDVAITGVTFNGVALTRYHEWAIHTGTGIGDFSLFYMVNPPEVIADVVMTLASSATQLNMSAQIYNRVNQTTPLGPIAASPLTATNSTNPSVVVTTEATDLVIDCLCWSTAGTYTPGGNQTEFAVSSLTNVTALRCSKETATGTSTTMSWTRPSQNHSMMAVAVKPLPVHVFRLPDLRGRVGVGRDNMGSVPSYTRTCVEVTGKVTANSTTISSIVYPASGSAAYRVCRNSLVVGAGIPDGTYVTDIASATSVTLSKAATVTGTAVPLRIGPLDGFTLGSANGYSVWTMSTAEMPAHTHTQWWFVGGGNQWSAGGAGYNQSQSAGTAATGGSDGHLNIQPSMILNKIIYAG